MMMLDAMALENHHDVGYDQCFEWQVLDITAIQVPTNQRYKIIFILQDERERILQRKHRSNWFKISLTFSAVNLFWRFKRFRSAPKFQYRYAIVRAN